MTCPICARAEMAKADHYAHCRACDYWMSDLEHDVASRLNSAHASNETV